MEYGNRIAELRKKRNLTQEQMANIVQISRASLSHYEQGRREPDLDTLNRIANFFKVSIDYLLGRTEDPNSNLDLNTLDFVESLELSDKDLFHKFTFTIDGRELTAEEARRFIAFIRAERTLKNDTDES